MNQLARGTHPHNKAMLYTSRQGGQFGQEVRAQKKDDCTPENERMSPDKGTILRGHFIFQPSFFRIQGSILYDQRQVRYGPPQFHILQWRHEVMFCGLILVGRMNRRIFCWEMLDTNVWKHPIFHQVHDCCKRIKPIKVRNLLGESSIMECLTRRKNRFIPTSQRPNFKVTCSPDSFSCRCRSSLDKLEMYETVKVRKNYRIWIVFFVF